MQPEAREASALAETLEKARIVSNSPACSELIVIDVLSQTPPARYSSRTPVSGVIGDWVAHAFRRRGRGSP
jgi:hypothetical protein